MSVSIFPSSDLHHQKVKKIVIRSSLVFADHKTISIETAGDQQFIKTYYDTSKSVFQFDGKELVQVTSTDGLINKIPFRDTSIQVTIDGNSSESADSRHTIIWRVRSSSTIVSSFIPTNIETSSYLNDYNHSCYNYKLSAIHSTLSKERTNDRTSV